MDNMSDMEKCTTYRREDETCTISCNLGLWAVSGKFGLALINEATHYFEQYKSDGEYSEILGGKNVLEKLKESQTQEHVIRKNPAFND